MRAVLLVLLKREDYARMGRIQTDTTKAIMYKPRRHIRLEQTFELPTIAECHRLLAEAEKSRGCTIELPWRSTRTYTAYSLTVRIELSGGMPIWSLYEGEGSRCRVVWSSHFEDIELMNDVLKLSLPQELLHPGESSAPGSGARRSQHHTTADITIPQTNQIIPPHQLQSGNSPIPQTGSQPPAIEAGESGNAAAMLLWEAALQQQQDAQNLAAYMGYYAGYAYQAYYPYGPYQFLPGQTPFYGQNPAPDAVPVAQSVPVVPGAVPGATPPPLPVVQPEQEAKTRPNVFLGSFLTEAGLIPETTLQAALQLQYLVRSGALNSNQAAQAVRQAHSRGGAIEAHWFSATHPAGDPRDARGLSPPLGSILVEAGLINPGALKAALNLQELVRTGVMTKDNAMNAFVRQHYGAVDPANEKDRESEQLLEFMQQAALLKLQDVEAARNVRKRHGGELSKILIAAGKLDKNLLAAAQQCLILLRNKRWSADQARAALHYCQRNRVTINEAAAKLELPSA